MARALWDAPDEEDLDDDLDGESEGVEDLDKRD